MKIKRYYHNKLIRNNVPKIIQARGGFFETKKVSLKEFRKLLRQKLVEEAREIETASKENLAKELSNLLEVIEAVAETENIEFIKVKEIQKQIRKIAGTYNNRTYLVWSDRPQGFGDKENQK